MTCRLEPSRIRDESLYCHSSDGADARNSGKPAHIFVLLGDRYHFTLQLFYPHSQAIDLIDNLFKSETRGGW